MLKTEPFPLPLFPPPEGWKRDLYSCLCLLSYRHFFFKSAGLCSFPSDLLPPLHIFILLLLCKPFKYVLNSRPVSALLVHKYVFNIYLATSDLGLPLPYFLFLCLSTPTKKIQFFTLSLGSAFLLYFLSFFFFLYIISCVPLFPHVSPLLIFFLTFLHVLLFCHAPLPFPFWSFGAFSAQFFPFASDFFPIEQLNLKDYRDILFSVIFYFIRACLLLKSTASLPYTPGRAGMGPKYLLFAKWWESLSPKLVCLHQDQMQTPVWIRTICCSQITNFHSKIICITHTEGQ